MLDGAMLVWFTRPGADGKSVMDMSHAVHDRLKTIRDMAGMPHDRWKMEHDMSKMDPGNGSRQPRYGIDLPRDGGCSDVPHSPFHPQHILSRR